MSPTPTGSVPACPRRVVDAATSAAAAISYLAARLAATKGAIPSAFGSGTDWTSTANAVLDLKAAELEQPQSHPHWPHCKQEPRHT